MESWMHCESQRSARARTERIKLGQGFNRAVFLKRLGCYSSPEPLLFFCFNMIFYQTLPLCIQLKNSVWNVVVLHPRHMLSQTLYSSKESLRKRQFLSHEDQQIYTITAIAHCKDITHLHTFHPWFSSACLAYMCKVAF